MKSDLYLFVFRNTQMLLVQIYLRTLRNYSFKINSKNYPEKILTDERCQKVRLVDLNLSGRLRKKVNLFKLASNCQ